MSSHMLHEIGDDYVRWLMKSTFLDTETVFHWLECPDRNGYVLVHQVTTDPHAKQQIAFHREHSGCLGQLRRDPLVCLALPCCLMGYLCDDRTPRFRPIDEKGVVAARYALFLNGFRMPTVAVSKGSTSTADLKYDVMLTHNWGTDTVGRDNHMRVMAVAQMLQSKGLSVWVDEQQLTGNINDQIAKAIDQSACVAVFITECYQSKITSGEDNFCKMEFNYASNRKKTSRMIPVVMEQSMSNTADWNGALGLHLGSCLYVSMWDENDFASGVEALHREIKTRKCIQVENSTTAPPPGLEDCKPSATDGLVASPSTVATVTG